MKNNFKILFYIKKNQPLKSGYYSILCRITINGMSCVFSTNLTTKLSKWNDVKRCVSGRNEEAIRTNLLLEDIRFSIYETYIKLRRNIDYITPQAIIGNFWSRDNTSDSLISLFNQHNREFGQMVGITRSRSTLNKYRYVCNHLQKFITTHYKKQDIPLNSIDVDFIRSFHRWLINNVKCGTNTTWLYMIAFKHILTIAVKRGLITLNPFYGYKLHNEQSHRNFLMKNELKKLMNANVKNTTEKIVRDAFIFSCFTGLSFTDIKALKTADIVGDKDNMYIAINRTKTHSPINIPLLSVAMNIISEYYKLDPNSIIFPLPSNHWCNNILIRLTKRVQISKHITFHCARHTFATTVTLSQGIPIEIVSDMLGHKNIKTTQIYAKVLQCTTNSEMDRASKNWNSYLCLSSH